MRSRGRRPRALRSAARLFVLAAGAALAVACFDASDDDTSEGDIARCRTICQASKACEGADPDRDCTTYCYDLDRIIVAGACRTRFGALLDCDESLDDICTESVDCDDELADYGACISAYCEGHGPECEDVFGA